jgi:hypothetical protein
MSISLFEMDNEWDKLYLSVGNDEQSENEKEMRLESR